MLITHQIQFYFLFRNHYRSHNLSQFSFGGCTFEIKFIQIAHAISTLQELLFLIWFDLVDLSGRLKYIFLKSTDLNTERTIVTLKYSMCRLKKHHLIHGLFLHHESPYHRLCLNFIWTGEHNGFILGNSFLELQGFIGILSYSPTNSKTYWPQLVGH